MLQIAREMVISPRNSRLGLSALVKRVGLMDQPDNPDGELIKYKVLHVFPLKSNSTIDVVPRYMFEIKMIFCSDYCYYFC